MQGISELAPSSQKLTSLSYKLAGLRDLPLRQFLECLLENNLTSLGEAPQEIITQHWGELRIQFFDAIVTSEAKNNISIESKIAHLSSMKALISLVVEALILTRDIKLIEVLRASGYSYDFTEDSFEADIENIRTEIKRFDILKGQYQAQIDINKERAGGGVMDYDYFCGVLNAISDMVKRDVNEDISTLRFCKYYKQLISKIEKDQFST